MNGQFESPAFDALAQDYDERFTLTRIGTAMRLAVWRRCAARFTHGSRILEMNCGTGEDAVWLAGRGMQVTATDVAPAMLAVGERKARAAALSSCISFQPLAWEELSTLRAASFDGALSNFGGLNCVSDLKAACRALHGRLKPGAPALLCIMGPHVPWEWVWYLARGNRSKAFRRISKIPQRWSGIELRYPSIAEARRTFSPEFRVLRVSALGAILPPPYTEVVFGRVPGLIEVLNALERSLESIWPLPQLADHYLLELART